MKNRARNGSSGRFAHERTSSARICAETASTWQRPGTPPWQGRWRRRWQIWQHTMAGGSSPWCSASPSCSLAPSTCWSSPWRWPWRACLPGWAPRSASSCWWLPSPVPWAQVWCATSGPSPRRSRRPSATLTSISTSARPSPSKAGKTTARPASTIAAPSGRPSCCPATRAASAPTASTPSPAAASC